MAQKTITHSQAIAASTEIIARIMPYCVRAQITGDARLGLDNLPGVTIICQPQRIAIDAANPVSKKVVHPGFGAAINQYPLKVIKGKYDGKHAIRFLQSESLGLWIRTDLLMYDEPDYWRQLAMSTGSESFKFKALWSSWYKKGWVGTADGLRLRKDCEQKGKKTKYWVCTAQNPTLPGPWNSEKDLFEWSGIDLKYLEPETRNWK